MLRLLVAEHCSANACDHFKDIIKNCLPCEEGGKLQLRRLKC